MLATTLGLILAQTMAPPSSVAPAPVPRVPRATVLPVPYQGPVTPMLVAVEVRSDGKLLWEGTLNVGAQQSSYRENRSEAPSPPCTPHRYSGTRETGLSVTLARISYGHENPDSIRVSLEWSRVDPSACPSANFVRKAALEGIADLPQGGTVRVLGDAGIEVRLTRR